MCVLYQRNSDKPRHLVSPENLIEMIKKLLLGNIVAIIEFSYYNLALVLATKKTRSVLRKCLNVKLRRETAHIGNNFFPILLQHEIFVFFRVTKYRILVGK